MTIIKPNHRLKYIKFLIVSGALLGMGGLVYVLEYNTLVDTRSDLRKTKVAIEKTRRENADLKNEVFGLTDPAKLKEIASFHSMVLDRNPDYVSVR